MRQPYTEKLKQLLRPVLFKIFKPNSQQFICPICDYKGPFKDKRISRTPNLVRINSKCPKCASNERHRMMHMVIQDLFDSWSTQGKSLLHIAPEDCLKQELSNRFSTYHTADLLKKHVDFNEDIQTMSFPDASYDCLVISRVLTVPPDLNASITEMRRVLRPDGIAIIAEIFKHDHINEFGKMINERSREMGVDLIDKLYKHFSRIDCFLSNKYDDSYQLTNIMKLDGKSYDQYPEKVKVTNTGFMELVLVCHV